MIASFAATATCPFSQTLSCFLFVHRRRADFCSGFATVAIDEVQLSIAHLLSTTCDRSLRGRLTRDSSGTTVPERSLSTFGLARSAPTRLADTLDASSTSAGETNMGILRRKNVRPTYPPLYEEFAEINPAIGNIITTARIYSYSNKAPRLVTESSNTFTAMTIRIPFSSSNKAPAAPDPHTHPVEYLRSIQAVRQRSKIILQKAKHNNLTHFDVDLSKFQDTADYVVSIIKRDFEGAYDTIPPHGRWQHFEVGGRPRITQLLQSWPRDVDATERARRLVDLFLVSVLLDAGAGNKWSYKSKESGKVYARSEGLAVASLEMFKAGTFSSNPDQPHQVDSAGLRKLTVATLAKGMQVSETNHMSGVEGRTGLLIRLSAALQNKQMFGQTARPGNMIDYLLSHPDTQMNGVAVVPLPLLWSVLMDGLHTIWPATRTNMQGKGLGDAWPCTTIPGKDPLQQVVPFHKLTQWLCYSIMVPMTKLANIHFSGADMLTGLPEYRNGGLLVDTGLLNLKAPDRDRGLRIYNDHTQDPGRSSVEVVPTFEPSDDVIVEWRAVTLGFLDDLLDSVNKGLHLKGPHKLSLAQMLEAGTWKGGREIAEVSRPITKGPPIGIISDGTVF